jgi:hypothetical protein
MKRFSRSAVGGNDASERLAMNKVLKLSSYRRPCGVRRVNARVITEEASILCETAFLASDWKAFERYFQILKSARSHGEKNLGERVHDLLPK